MRKLLACVALVSTTAAVCFAISASTGLASKRGTDYTLAVGDNAVVESLDVSCSYLGATVRNPAQMLLCSRPGTGASVGVVMTADWIRVWRFPASNAGMCCKTLLFQQRRNP